MTAADWGVSAADWNSIPASVTEIAISTDAFNDADTTGTDNFSLVSEMISVPEPSTLALLIADLLGFGLARSDRSG